MKKVIFCSVLIILVAGVITAQASFIQDEAKVHFDKGMEFLYQGNNDFAIKEFSQAITINSDYADAYFYRATTYDKQFYCRKSIADYTKVIDLDPKKAPQAYHNRALANFILKRFDQAWDDINKAKDLGENIDPQELKKLKFAAGK